MSTTELLLRYIHIVNSVSKSPATFKEIDDYLTRQSAFQDYKFNISQRQFLRDLKKNRFYPGNRDLLWSPTGGIFDQWGRILRVEQTADIKSLPLHESQKILIDEKNELRIKLKLFVTHDLVMELLSIGANMKILQPDSLVLHIRTAYQEAYKQY